MATNQSKTRNGSSEGRSKGGQNSSGNFKHDPQRAAEAGRKGGEARSRNHTTQHSNINSDMSDLDMDRRENMGNR